MRRLVSRSWLGRCFAALLVAQVVGGVSLTHADARSSYLVRLLEGSSQFRVRAQAAISLGAVGDEPSVVKALVTALKDQHPAVRAAAAASLGRLEAKAAVASLKALEQDREEPVRSAAASAIARIERSRTEQPDVTPPKQAGPVRYYVAIGTPGSRVEGLDRDVLQHAREVIRTKLAEVDGVEIAPDGEGNAQAKRVIARRNLKGFYVDSSITGVQERPGGGTRVVVSVVLATYPGRDMRAIMHGAATAMGGGSTTYQQALEGAISGALRQLPQALER